jgi:hypothetical protein
MTQPGPGTHRRFGLPDAMILVAVTAASLGAARYARAVTLRLSYAKNSGRPATRTQPVSMIRDRELMKAFYSALTQPSAAKWRNIL